MYITFISTEALGSWGIYLETPIPQWWKTAPGELLTSPYFLPAPQVNQKKTVEGAFISTQ